MKANEIREAFIDFFRKRGHTVVRSAPIFPKDDPSLLFTNAGMNQFKNIFLGVSNERGLARAVDSQKCMRVSGKHNDLEEVGKDGTHHTFFEMLGNWSFGDYYKKEAIAWAWELLTTVFKIPKERLYATVYKEDEDAERLWKSETDIAPARILRFDRENFWEMGETGPCGPCSEIHFDRGEELSCGPKCTVNCSCGRFMEIWNLVFIQYNRKADSSLEELKSKHVDTGMGFERITALIQKKPSNYATDVFQPLISKLEKMSGKTYLEDLSGMPFRVIADHTRALIFAITDGVLPSNDGRGYVMRRLLRRAFRYGKKLGFNAPFINELVPELVLMMGQAYPELVERADFVKRIIEAEEKSFEKTLDKGLGLFEEAALAAKKAGAKEVDGKTAFKLYDTYGFPADLTNQLAQEAGLALDQKGFEEEMRQQKERARASSKFKDMQGAGKDWIEVSAGASSAFTGYGSLSEAAAIRKVRKTAQGFDFILDKTPFYPEQGGQCGDAGLLIIEDRATIEIVDTKKQGQDIVHIGRIEGEFEFTGAEKATAQVDEARRNEIRKNHTATHIVQYALRKVVGSHVKQAGSLNNPDRLRFDFTHYAGLSEDELLNVERVCNEIVLMNLGVNTVETSLKEAETLGALALFGEKYGDRVRVVKIGNESIELCGGTHVRSTGEIGYIQIVSESSISAGMRRIEAVTGRRFGEDFRAGQIVVKGLCRTLKTTLDKIPEQVSLMADKIKTLEKEMAALKQKSALANVDDLLKAAREVNGVRFVKEHLQESDRASMQAKAETLAAKIGSGVVALFGLDNGKGVIMVAVSQDLIAGRKLNAGNILKVLSEAAGGKGGGRPNLAQGGAKDAASLESVFGRAEEIAGSVIK